jgi:hypothetical protein
MPHYLTVSPLANRLGRHRLKLQALQFLPGLLPRVLRELRVYAYVAERA